jgi:hypothetical protein
LAIPNASESLALAVVLSTLSLIFFVFNYISCIYLAYIANLKKDRPTQRTILLDYSSFFNTQSA